MRRFKLMRNIFMSVSIGLVLAACSSKGDRATIEDTIVVQEEQASLIGDGIPAVIDFYATWCGPCKKMAPFYDQLKEKYSDKINFITVDIDQQPEIAKEYNVTAVPTFVIVDEEGKEIDRVTGALPDSLEMKVKTIAANYND